MANKIPWYVTVDWKSVISTSIVVLVVMSVTFYIYWPDIQYSSKIALYKGETIGTVMYVKENIEQKQNRYGNNVVVDSYTVHYNYHVNGVNYSGLYEFQGTYNNGRLLNRITSEKSNRVKVKFDFSKPRKSVIVLE